MLVQVVRLEVLQRRAGHLHRVVHRRVAGLAESRVLQVLGGQLLLARGERPHLFAELVQARGELGARGLDVTHVLVLVDEARLHEVGDLLEALQARVAQARAAGTEERVTQLGERFAHGAQRLHAPVGALTQHEADVRAPRALAVLAGLEVVHDRHGALVVGPDAQHRARELGDLAEDRLGLRVQHVAESRLGLVELEHVGRALLGVATDLL